jgi:hypothetical protein
MESAVAAKKTRTRKPVVKLEIIEPVSEPKKGGRKSKGAKIVTTVEKPDSQAAPLVNVILHLKCSTKDLNEYNNKLNQFMTDNYSYSPLVPPPLQTFNSQKIEQFSKYDENNESVKTYDAFPSKLCTVCNCTPETTDDADDKNISNKEINSKLRNLKIMLNKGISNDHKSACFWCTYDYDNPSCIIPKQVIDGVIHGYGAFCRPECAVAYLMREMMDDSTKFERYHLLNNIYGKIYNYNKNIKPAPNPYYTLEKYYGNMTIQEYRKMLKSDMLLMTVDKPLTRMLPEIHEETDETILNKTGTYKVKRQSEKVAGPSKNDIMKNAFGLSC